MSEDITPEETDQVEPDITDEVEGERELAAETEAEADGTEVEEAPPVPTGVELDDLPAALEAVLLVIDEPVSEVLLAQVLEHPVDVVTEQLRALADDYTNQGRGFELREVAGGWRF